MPIDDEPADNSQEVLLINRSGNKTKKIKGLGKQRNPSPRTNQRNSNDIYFRCRENLDFPAVNRARDVFIPIELHFKRDRAVTAEELEKACVDDRKVILLHWNMSFQTKRKVQGVNQWFQHDRRRDSGFPFNPGPAARLQIPKNVHVQV